MDSMDDVEMVVLWHHLQNPFVIWLFLNLSNSLFCYIFKVASLPQFMVRPGCQDESPPTRPRPKSMPSSSSRVSWLSIMNLCGKWDSSL